MNAELATFLISANWFMGIVFLAYFTVAASMVGSEEATLMEKFGDEHRASMQRTGRSLPSLVVRE